MSDAAAATPEVRLSGAAALLLHELLHAMAQPLTGLQLCRLPAARGEVDSHTRELLDDLAGQVESLTAMYRALRLLLEEAAEDPEGTELASMVQKLERGWRQRATRRGFKLRVQIDEPAAEVWGSPGVAQALDRIFDAVFSETSADPASQITVTVRGAEILFTSTSETQPPDPWSLRVAQLLLERAAGTVVYTGQPVSARVRLAHV